MSRSEDAELLCWCLEAKIRKCRDALICLITLQAAGRESGAQVPRQEKEFLTSLIETSAVSHQLADRIFASLLTWITENELNDHFGYLSSVYSCHAAVTTGSSTVADNAINGEHPPPLR